MTRLGLLALVCYAVHGGFHVAHGRPLDLLWACHLGAALVGIGLLGRSATVNAIGTLVLAVGTPLWLLELASGGEFLPTSLLTHVLALAIGLYGVRRLGMPAGAWWKAVVATLALILLCRLVTPASANINVAHSVPPPWRETFPSHSAYLATMMAVAAACFFALERTLRHLAGRPTEGPAGPPAAEEGQHEGVDRPANVAQ
jgi:hypothetical protein